MTQKDLNLHDRHYSKMQDLRNNNINLLKFVKH